MCESSGKHPLGLKATVYLTRALRGRGVRSVEEECKMTKIKSAIRLYSNEDPTMRLVRAFEENALHLGHQSLVKEAREFAEELRFTLDLSFPHPSAVTTQMEQMCQEIRSRGTSKRLQWSNGKLKARKRNGKESSSQRDGRRTS